MRLRREVSLSIGAILALQILLSMLAIALLTRMGPAIEQILRENVYSEEAVEEMVALLAMGPQGPVPKAFEDAMGRAKDNVTEEPERPLLAIIERNRAEAFAGNPTARQTVITALRDLGKVNRASMDRADNKAQRLGQAGAWAAALLGALTLALGIIVYRRLRVRLELPIEELFRTTQRVRAGNLQARCVTSAGPYEVKQIANDLNWLFDEWLQESRDEVAGGDEEREAEVRRTLAWVLDRVESAAVVLDAEGKRITANRAGMLVESIDDPTGERWTIEEVPGTSLRLLTHTTPQVDI